MLSRNSVATLALTLTSGQRGEIVSMEPWHENVCCGAVIAKRTQLFIPQLAGVDIDIALHGCDHNPPKGGCVREEMTAITARPSGRLTSFSDPRSLITRELAIHMREFGVVEALSGCVGNPQRSKTGKREGNKIGYRQVIEPPNEILPCPFKGEIGRAQEKNNGGGREVEEGKGREGEAEILYTRDLWTFTL